MTTTTQGYARSQIILHWMTVVLVALQYLLHDGIDAQFEINVETGTTGFSALALLHMGLGAIILGLAILRLALRREIGTPAPPDGEPGWAKAAARATHLAFYVLLILLPVSGAVAWARRSETAGDAHEVMRLLLLILILAHVGAVLVHQFVWKTGLLSRMTRPGS